MMDFGLSFDKLLIIGVVAVFLLGPERLPKYAAQLGRLVRSLRTMANSAKDRMRDEMGPEFDEIEWKKLDPRQYDPRKIIRDALANEAFGDESKPPTPAADATAASDAAPVERPVPTGSDFYPVDPTTR
jgi:sec-independent protein translocase protein TatB